MVTMAELLNPTDHPWVRLVAPEDLADMRKDLERGADPGHCSHGDPVDEVIAKWRYFALDGVEAPSDWVAFDLSAELWFGYLGPESTAECRRDFAAAASDADRERLFYGWRSTGAIMSDPALAASLSAPIEGPLEDVSL